MAALGGAGRTAIPLLPAPPLLLIGWRNPIMDESTQVMRKDAARWL